MHVIANSDNPTPIKSPEFLPQEASPGSPRIVITAIAHLCFFSQLDAIENLNYFEEKYIEQCIGKMCAKCEEKRQYSVWQGWGMSTQNNHFLSPFMKPILSLKLHLSVCVHLAWDG